MIDNLGSHHVHMFQADPQLATCSSGFKVIAKLLGAWWYFLGIRLAMLFWQYRAHYYSSKISCLGAGVS